PALVKRPFWSLCKHDPTNINSVYPLNDRNSLVTPATPQAPWSLASLVIRSSAAARPLWIAAVTSSTSPPRRPRPTAVTPPRKPIELTLLPMTTSPAAKPFRPIQNISLPEKPLCVPSYPLFLTETQDGATG